MKNLKHRFILGAMIGGVLLAATMMPVQAVLAASSDTTSASPDSSQSQSTAPSDNLSTGSGGQGTANNQPGPGQSSPSGQTNATGQTGGSSSNSGSTSTQSAPSSGSNTTSGSGNDTSSTTAPTGGANPSQTGAGNTNSSNDSQSSSSATTATADPTTSTQNTDTSLAINSTTVSNARSGDVGVSGNRSVGNISSGKATNTTTQINLLNSSTSLSIAGSLQTFTYDITGDHVGDIILSPADFLQSSTASVQDPGNVNVNNQTDATITNTIDLSAQSGDVTVEGNDTVGNISSGDAATQADIINMINSVVSDKQAFLGIVNIDGNLKGNLLLPKSTIDELLPNIKPAASPAATNSGTATTTTDNNLTVNNNVTVDATSGDVTVEGNHGIRSVTSGAAGTDVKLYNMTNSQIVGGNVLLVFVNVMGSWVGLLMNAPAGTTSAAFGGGITEDVSTSASYSVTNTVNETITNNVKLKSKSGNVGVAGNESTGDVGSGKASANADIVNILGSEVDLSGWLGVLIINVYGSWNGSLEIQPAATTLTVHAAPHHKPLHHHSRRGSTIGNLDEFADPAAPQQLVHQTIQAAEHILGDTTTKPSKQPRNHLATLSDDKHRNTSLFESLFITVVVLIIGAAVTAARVLAVRRSRKA